MEINAVDRVDSGLRALCGVAAFYRISADPDKLRHDLALRGKQSDTLDLVRAARYIGLKARFIQRSKADRFRRAPVPALVKLENRGYFVYGGPNPNGMARLVDPVTRSDLEMSFEDLISSSSGTMMLVGRKVSGAGSDPREFGFSWFVPSIWRYRKPIFHVLLASLFIQVFALVTPLFFQVVIDKVLAHKGYSTLFVLVAGIAILGLFDVVLQQLRTYALSHTTNRIDVELGQRLFQHLLRLPLGYFETRSAGQTVARISELETIRGFLTGQALFSLMDLLFTFVFVAVLWIYSWQLTLIILAAVPIYALVAVLIRPPLRELVKEKFNRGAASQQFLVETVVGVQTIKSAAVEPIMQAQWEEKLASYVRTSFDATMLGSFGQNTIQYVSKLSSAALLLFGAKAVIDGQLSVGSLIAFNMIAGQVTQPVLRLSQLWQDFQQVKISVDRLGDILNFPTELRPLSDVALSTPKGEIELSNVTFRYKPGTPEVLRSVTLSIKAGETIGIVGPSGSGKSTLTKLVQRLYTPEEGRVALDGADVAHLDPAWLRRHIGVVLQENLLFNRSIHENIAFSNPVLSRAQVIAVAKLAGADEFISRLPQGYDSLVEERGANLSGGQRQRIAIARALATNPPVLIFDEATSALDYESERIVQENMKRIAHGRTVIVIAHRLAAVRQSDRIIGLVEGRIVEEGTHTELLMKAGGLYARLWALQNNGGTM